MSAALSAWWAERSTRERRLLTALAAVAVVALLLIAVVRPLQAARGRALADIRTYQTLAARLRAAGPRGPAVPLRTGDPAAIVASSAAGAGLSPLVAPGPGGTVATLTAAPYDATLRWIADLEATSALRVDDLSVTPAAPGLVDARVVLR